MEMRWEWLLQGSIRAGHWGINKLGVLKGWASRPSNLKKAKGMGCRGEVRAT